MDSFSGAVSCLKLLACYWICSPRVALSSFIDISIVNLKMGTYLSAVSWESARIILWMMFRPSPAITISQSSARPLVRCHHPSGLTNNFCQPYPVTKESVSVSRLHHYSWVIRQFPRSIYYILLLWEEAVKRSSPRLLVPDPAMWSWVCRAQLCKRCPTAP